MLTRLLYRLYGALTAIPRIGPRLDRWARTHRSPVYRLRNWAARVDLRWQRRADPSMQNAINDLSTMIGALRQASQRLHERMEEQQSVIEAVRDRMEEQRSVIEAVRDRLDTADPAALNQQWQQQLYQHTHAVNLKVDNALESLLQRVERAERLAGQRTHSALPDSVSRILDPERLAQHRQRPQGLWLEVGCGDKPDIQRINVDLRPLPGVDIVAPAQAIPLPDGCVANLRAAHLIEHFTRTDFAERVLPEWWRLLAPGGTLELITPDLQAMAQAWLRGDLSEPDLVHILYGGQDYPGDFHYHLYSPAALQNLLLAHGLRDVVVMAAARPNGLCLEFELHARKPAG